MNRYERFFFGLSATWLSAEAATVFTGAGDFGLLSSLDATFATLGLVFSFLAMGYLLVCHGQERSTNHSSPVVENG